MEIFNDYYVTVVVGVCLCVGYVIKSLNFINNKYIPLIMATIGIVFNIWYSASISPEIILGGLFSGLSSTGMYELFSNFLNRKG